MRIRRNSTAEREGAWTTVESMMHNSPAIRTAGRSRVILQWAYQISDEDRVSTEPGSEIIFSTHTSPHSPHTVVWREAWPTKCFGTARAAWH